MNRLSKQCGILNIPQPYRPPLPVTGTALLVYVVSIVKCALYCLCSCVCCVLFERGVFFCVIVFLRVAPHYGTTATGYKPICSAIK
jgi:hypothetical protein